MKTILVYLCLAICSCSVSLYGQSNITSRNGDRFPAKGVFRVFIVFAEVIDDHIENEPANWPSGQLPNNPERFIDFEVSNNYKSFISRYYNEVSFGNLHVIGDYYPHLIKFTLSSMQDPYNSVFNFLHDRCIDGQIKTAGGLDFPNDFDLWDLGQSANNVKGKQKDNKPDGEIDCIMIFWRVNSKVGSSRSGGQIYHNYSHPIAIGNKRGISTRGIIYSDSETVFGHEIAHGIIGDNDFHSGGAGGGTGTFMENHGGYGILSNYNRNLIGYCAWDRYRLGWKNPQQTYDISARDLQGNEMNADIQYEQKPVSDSLVLVLRNFSTTGDAARIKLPYIRTLNPQAKEQWIWLENHQILPNTMEYEEYKYGPSSQMNKIPKGLRLMTQIGNEDFSSFTSTTNYIAPIYSFGNFDFTDHYKNESGIYVAVTDDTHANPFTGVGISSSHSIDLDNNNLIQGVEGPVAYELNYNGSVLDESYWGYMKYTIFGSVFDAFYPGESISISTNPAPVPRITYERTQSTIPNASPRLRDNRKIYLNGLSIKVLEQKDNGEVVVCIKWNDYDVKNEVRWCGDIVLNEQINLKRGCQLLLDYGLNPVRPVNPVMFNGQKVFSSPTVFTCKNGSVINTEISSRIIIQNNSMFIAESGSTINLEGGSLLTVKSGSVLQIKQNASLHINGEGKIVIEEGGYLCIEPGANINLKDYKSLIFLEEGAVLGSNVSSECLSSVPFTGNGQVIDRNSDVYIQNENIMSSRYFGGRNIYVGKNVTTTKPVGDVIVSNNAHVIFDASGEIVFDKGFELKPGASMEVVK